MFKLMDNDHVLVESDTPITYIIEQFAWLTQNGLFADTHKQFVVIEETPLSKIDFMHRFTDTELITIYTAAKQNISIEVWLDKFKLSSEVSLSDSRTIDGIKTLEAVGLLAVGRSAEILANGPARLQSPTNIPVTVV
jgi:hypothetical protein